MELSFLTDVSCLAASPMEAMVTAAKLVQDDLAIMVENDGK